MKRIRSIITVVLIALSCASLADEGLGLSFYRGTDGLITQASAKNAKAMGDHAKSNGYIDLWWFHNLIQYFKSFTLAPLYKNILLNSSIISVLIRPISVLIGRLSCKLRKLKD